MTKDDDGLPEALLPLVQLGERFTFTDKQWNDLNRSILLPDVVTTPPPAFPVLPTPRVMLFFADKSPDRNYSVREWLEIICENKPEEEADEEANNIAAEKAEDLELLYLLADDLINGICALNGLSKDILWSSINTSIDSEYKYPDMPEETGRMEYYLSSIRELRRDLRFAADDVDAHIYDDDCIKGYRRENLMYFVKMVDQFLLWAYGGGLVRASADTKKQGMATPCEDFVTKLVHLIGLKRKDSAIKTAIRDAIKSRNGSE